VLNAPGKSELIGIEQGMTNAMTVIEMVVNGNFEDAMKALHT
jgi:PTH1 family peptidyl-tRNA hydrolase